MLWYSRTRKDYIQKLVEKYRENPFNTVSKSKMKELVYIYWEDCARCHTLKPHVEKWCYQNWYTFKEMKYADSWLEISSIPQVMINDDQGERILDYDGIVALISNQK